MLLGADKVRLFIQTWQRLTPLGCGTWAYRLREVQTESEPRQGFLLGAGDYFFLALNRPGEPVRGGGPLACHLSALLSAANSQPQEQLSLQEKCRIAELLGMELSFGCTTETWRTEVSTTPDGLGSGILGAGDSHAWLAEIASRGEPLLLKEPTGLRARGEGHLSAWVLTPA